MQIPEIAKFYIRRIVYNVLYFFSPEKRETFFRREKSGFRDIPIFIISYNRLSYVKNFVEQLERYGLTNIHIIDNNSSYPPLLEYYKQCKYDVIYMKENLGHMVFWKSELFKEYRQDFYVVTDPDLEFIENCPDDFMEVFFKTLRKYPFVRKVGFSLKIDDLPDNEFTKEIVAWESQYYHTEIKKDGIYYAGVDTTFALYLPDNLVKHQKFLSAFRTAMPYQMRHLPWYKDTFNITDEDRYYSEHKTNGWSDPVKGFKPDEEQSQ